MMPDRRTVIREHRTAAQSVSEQRGFLERTWQGDLVCRQTGPCQTLRADNWWTQLLMRFRVFVVCQKITKSLQRGQKSRNMLIWKESCWQAKR